MNIRHKHNNNTTQHNKNQSAGHSRYNHSKSFTVSLGGGKTKQTKTTNNKQQQNNNTTQHNKNQSA